MDAYRRKLLFRSDHRGTKEMDVILGVFAREFLPQASDEDAALYEEVLKESDPDLYNWISEREPLPDDKADNPVLKQLIGFQVKQ
jgi:antitoxin CptB